ncbi:hypothetical protein BDV59DRAFT_180360 [Aspergillus ambiguus]|uniref:uncharacterized protein n=1 Tax=Aspergillus ambiguus TaxID=176160 RepID=UPI003CCD3D38
MPKPRHLPVSDGDQTAAPNIHKANVLTKALKRRATESSQTESVDSHKGESEKKQSRMAVLKSKFSLKDIGRDFRKDSPLPSMPSLPKDGVMLQGERKSAGPEGPYHEARLYMPTAGESEVHPLSAPPFQTTITSDADGVNNHSLVAPEKLEIPLQAGAVDKVKISLYNAAYLEESPVLGKADPMQHVRTVLLDGSSHPARTGEYSNEGHAEIINSDHRVPSMQAQGEPFTSVVNKPAVIPAAASPYVVSVKSNAETVKEKQSAAAESNHAVKKSDEKTYPLVVSSQQMSSVASSAEQASSPFIVSSDQATYNNQYYAALGQPATFGPDLSTFDPLQTMAQNPQYPAQHAMGYDAYYAGVTGHGGYAPPPPQPGYQNTVTLEQHVASQADAIHHHLDTALNRVGRTLENSNNRVSDQILRSVDSMGDLVRSLNIRSIGHTEALKEIHRMVVDVRMQLSAMQRENRQLEDRVLTLFYSEVAKVRADISALSSRVGSIPYNPVMVPRPVTELQGAPDVFHRGVRSSENKLCYSKKPKKAVRKDEVEVQREETERMEEHNSTEGIVGPCDFLNKHAETEQTSGTHMPSSSPDTDKPNIFTQLAIPRTILKNPARVSSGSPEPKSTSLKTAAPSTVEPENGNIQAPSASSTESAKTPSKRGMFYLRRPRDDDKLAGGRFLQTPRRNRPNTTNNPEMQKTHPSTPQSKSAPTSPRSHLDRIQNQRDGSPSSIHPALRNTRQRQIMAERERLAQQTVQQSLQMDTVAAAQRPGLRAQPSQPVIHVNLPVAAHYPYAGIAYGPVPMMYHHPQLAQRQDVVNRAHMPRFGALSDSFGGHSHHSAAENTTSAMVPPAPGHAPPSVAVQRSGSGETTKL